MIFCSECFKDSQLKEIIRSRKIRGECASCGCKNAYIYDILKDEYLDGFLDELINIYIHRRKTFQRIIHLPIFICWLMN